MQPKFLLSIFCLFISSLIFCQRVKINGVVGDRALTWDDFRGKPDKSSSHAAYTQFAIQSKANGASYKGDTIIWDMEIWVELVKDSWVKDDKRSDTLLQHEEAHFIIGKLWALELEKKIRNTVVLRNNYQQLINAITKEIADKYKAMTVKYDEETNHSKNREQQWKWNAFLKRELDIATGKVAE